jgi:putative transposase
MSSRSLNDRYLADSGVSWIDGMPPRSRNQRAPTGPDVPHARAASSLDNPSAIFTQNSRSTSRRIGGRPGDRIAGRPVSVTIHPGGLPIQHLRHEVLRRPVEFTQYLALRYTERLATAGIAPSVGTVGDSYDNALAESVIGLYKTEVIRRQGPWRHVEAVEFATLAWVDWFNTRRLLAPLGHVPPIEYERAYYDRHATPVTEAGLN